VAQVLDSILRRGAVQVGQDADDAAVEFLRYGPIVGSDYPADLGVVGLPADAVRVSG
jgi:hypothetical protein